MIEQYYCPETIDETLKLLGRTDPPVYPLGGGSILSQPTAARYAVADLQRLHLDRIVANDGFIHLGATATLQTVVDEKLLPQALHTAAKREVSFNTRQTATAAGTIVSSPGNSAFTTALLALGAQLVWLPGGNKVDLGEYLNMRKSWARNQLLTEIILAPEVDLRYTDVSRTPADMPIVCAAVATLPGGRVRIALGGPGETPILLMDGKDVGGAAELAYTAYSHVFTLDNSSKSYLQEMCRVLVRRLLAA